MCCDLGSEGSPKITNALADSIGFEPESALEADDEIAEDRASHAEQLSAFGR